MKTIARLKHLSVGPLKVRRFANTIKGEPVDRAQAILDLQSSPTCQALLKLLRSAIANAENNNGLSPENLVVSNVMVDQGPSMKRIRPRARGRAYRILKRSSHVTIELDLKAGMSESQVQEEHEAKRPQRGKPKQAKDTSTVDKAATETTAKTAKKKPAAGGKKEQAQTGKSTAKKVTKTSAGKDMTKAIQKGDKGSKE